MRGLDPCQRLPDWWLFPYILQWDESLEIPEIHIATISVKPNTVSFNPELLHEHPLSYRWGVNPSLNPTSEQRHQWPSSTKPGPPLFPSDKFDCSDTYRYYRYVAIKTSNLGRVEVRRRTRSLVKKSWCVCNQMNLNYNFHLSSRGNAITVMGLTIPIWANIAHRIRAENIAEKSYFRGTWHLVSHLEMVVFT